MKFKEFGLELHNTITHTPQNVSCLKEFERKLRERKQQFKLKLMKHSFWNEHPSNSDINYIFDRPQSQVQNSESRKIEGAELYQGIVIPIYLLNKHFYLELILG